MTYRSPKESQLKLESINMIIQLDVNCLVPCAAGKSLNRKEVAEPEKSTMEPTGVHGE